MAVEYSAIYQIMQDETFYTAKDLGVHVQSLLAMEKRGMIQRVPNSKPLQFIKSRAILPKILEVLVNWGQPEFFTVYKEGDKLPMLCYVKNERLMDCYDNPYTEVEKIQWVENNRTKQKLKF